LNLDGKTVTIDAIGTQKDIVDQICSKNGNYVLALKRNQHALYDDVSLYMKDVANGAIIDSSMQYYKDISADHGRIETRECWVVNNIDWLDNKERWTNLRSLVLIKSTVSKKKSLTENVRFFISSHATSAKHMLHYARGHWSIENQLHWPLDVIFLEDTSTVRDVYGIQNIATLKSTALSLLLQNEMKISTRNKRARAASALIYLLEVLLNKVF
jgi:predicted transposase YbfD/YdcC